MYAGVVMAAQDMELKFAGRILGQAILLSNCFLVNNMCMLFQAKLIFFLILFVIKLTDTNRIFASSPSIPILQHSQNCGAGTGIFLLINASVIIIIRGHRFCLWGSVYLDAHGEEDRDLR